MREQVRNAVNETLYRETLRELREHLNDPDYETVDVWTPRGEGATPIKFRQFQWPLLGTEDEQTRYNLRVTLWLKNVAIEITTMTVIWGEDYNPSVSVNLVERRKVSYEVWHKLGGVDTFQGQAEALVSKLTGRNTPNEKPNYDLVVCPRCNGYGEVTVAAGGSINSPYTDHYEIPCPLCDGQGEVERWEAMDFKMPVDNRRKR